jgi:hypothetical protein
MTSSTPAWSCRGPIPHSPSTGAIHSASGKGSQLPYQDIVYPGGVARTVIGGQMVIINYHHLNTSTGDVWGQHAIALHHVDASEVVYEARTFTFVNPAFEVPAGEERSFTSECTFDHDLQVWALTRHTHRWGTDFEVSFIGDERSGEIFWTSEHYEEDTNFRFATRLGLDTDTVQMKAGDGFRFTCHFDNTTDDTLRFGFEARDEMASCSAPTGTRPRAPARRRRAASSARLTRPASASASASTPRGSTEPRFALRAKASDCGLRGKEMQPLFTSATAPHLGKLTYPRIKRSKDSVCDGIFG